MMAYCEASSLDLVERASGGDQDAATQLYERYTRRLLGVVQQHIARRFRSRFDADDVLSSTWRTFFRDSGRFAFDDDQNFWKLLATIALNKVRRYVERNGAHSRDPRREQHLDVDFIERLSRRPGPHEVLEAAELMDAILGRLDGRSARVLQLRCEGYAQQEIARQLRISERTVRRCLECVRAAAEEVVRESPTADVP